MPRRPMPPTCTFRDSRLSSPATPHDVKGLLFTAIEDENPVLFIEDKMMYNMKGEVPEGYYTVPFGKAAIRHEGKDITVVATMRMVHKALTVAKEMEEKGIGVEVIDPRTLCPLDEETIINSFKKTGKMVIVDEGHRVGNFGSEVAAIIAEKAVDYIQAPILKVTAPQVLCSLFARPGEGSLHPERRDDQEGHQQGHGIRIGANYGS